MSTHKPLLLHRIQGTGRKARMKKREQELQLTPSDMGPAPAWFTEQATAEWDLLTNHPEYCQVLSLVDRGLLTQCCYLHGKMILNMRDPEVFKFGSTEAQLLHSCRMQLGITPASRAKVKAPPQAKLDNPFSQLG